MSIEKPCCPDSQPIVGLPLHHMPSPSRTSSRSVRSASDIPLSDEILFATRESFGVQILVARSTNGVCAVITDTDPHRLQMELASAFPCHACREDSVALKGDLDQVIDFINF
ncbi:MAG TPA: hypothetical protein VN280_08775 [Variovorax sp.]|nr:hypothetical protein [Variovorax sp.]